MSVYTMMLARQSMRGTVSVRVSVSVSVSYSFSVN